ncbi:hypothetical protein KKF84_12430 [Myxococcota bacterium]|nr:hypothetical protein [Myxococcota bacterium]MBU1536122.1 hypothetical protein [Myxococcota bacterium]
MSSSWDDIHKVINQIVSIRDNHVTLEVNVKRKDNGKLFVDLGSFGSATVSDLEQAHLFLGGVLMGMNINRG